MAFGNSLFKFRPDSGQFSARLISDVIHPAGAAVLS